MLDECFKVGFGRRNTGELDDLGGPFCRGPYGHEYDTRVVT